MSERPFPPRRPAAGTRFKQKPGRSREAWSRGERPRQSALEGDRTVLYGWHPVIEALRNGKRPLHRLLATENSARRLREELGQTPIEPEIVRPEEINRLVEPDAVHQGLYLE